MNTRDLLNHGPGKGDKPRTKLDENFRRRYEAIQWGLPFLAGYFQKRGNKRIKKYGK